MPEVNYSEEEIASFKSIFDMFDKSGTGRIDLKDFLSIMASLNRKEEEVNEILDEYGYREGENARDNLSFEEFIELMQTLERRILVNEREL